MIDWRVILGTLGSGLVVTFWLESRLGKSRERWLVLMGVTAVFNFSLFVWVAVEPWWNLAARLAPPAITLEMSDEPALSAEPPALPPPHTFLMASASDEPAPPLPATANASHDTAYLRIPALAIAQAIVEIPLRNGRWDVSQLGSQVGWLAGTGTHPGANQAMVFAGHMTFPTATALEEGAFANLQYVTYGTEVIYHQGGHDLVYEVTEINRVDPSDIEQVHLADGNSILLLTCTDWDGNGYINRLLVRATLVPENQ